MNTQAPESRIINQLLQVHSIFHTIQGEGPFAGTPAVFIRLTGCNLQCPGCDTEYTSVRAQVTLQGILSKVCEVKGPLGGTRLVVITGGEPFRQEIGNLVKLLIMHSYYVQIETNGTLPPPSDVEFSYDFSKREGAFIVCSPKTGKMNAKVALLSCAFKYVINSDSVDQDDGLPILALDHSASPRVARPPVDNPKLNKYVRPVYVQPMDCGNSLKNSMNLNAAVKSCMERGYILQLQLHKILGVE